MKALVRLLVACLVATPSLAEAKTYNCHVSKPLALYRNAEKADLKEINFPKLGSEPWEFTVEIKKGKKNDLDAATVRWPSDPIQIAGSFPVIPTAEGAIAFSAVQGGPCMFTVNACVAMVQIADQDFGKAKVSILPSALWTDDQTKKSDPFVAIIDGTCTWKDS
ncbi:MAG: hypothetical protein HOO94_01370 [Novosphingobium sp.]|uniref:hypothetical protein n=1 Tax=Novosphingobium sp. TaxID=1874826 RepID=UPI00183A493B|nr:hypothetical protein [Novosphingobium sp.]